MGKRESQRGEALVALVNNLADWRILQDQLWYRVPVEAAPKRWPPRWLAFYQTKIFRDEAYAVRYFGQVKAIKKLSQKDSRRQSAAFLSREKSILEPIFAHFSAPDCTVGTGARPFEIVS